MVRLLDFLSAVIRPRPRRGAACFGLLILGCYVFAMWHWNREIAREAATRNLREKVVEWVSQQPPKPGGYQLSDLRQAGVLVEEDLAFLEQQGYEYHAIGPDSPDRSVLFLEQRDENHTWYCYKDGSTSYQKLWPAPSGKAVLRDMPHPDRDRVRLLQLVRVGIDAPLGQYVTVSHYRPVHWNREGDLVAIDAPLEGFDVPLTIWRVEAGRAEILPLPQEMSMNWLLSLETPHAETNWGMDFMEAQGWTGARELLVHAQGHGSYVHPPTGKKMSFNLIYRVFLEVDSPGVCRIKRAVRKHFAQSELP